jgi:hypothetical protein
MGDENRVNIANREVAPFEQKSDGLARKSGLNQDVRFGVLSRPQLPLLLLLRTLKSMAITQI